LIVTVKEVGNAGVYKKKIIPPQSCVNRLLVRHNQGDQRRRSARGHIFLKLGQHRRKWKILLSRRQTTKKEDKAPPYLVVTIKKEEEEEDHSLLNQQ
jgi:hypothetical protein